LGWNYVLIINTLISTGVLKR